jgi:heterodisulfide reductase subunit B
LNQRAESTHRETLRCALFIGCTIAYKLPHIEAASRYVMEGLGVEPVDLPFSCCPDPNGVHAYSAEMWATLAARNLALAEEAELDLVTLCSGCYATLKHCRQLLQTDAELKKRVNQRLQAVGRRFTGESRVIHFYELLHEQIGYDRLQAHVAAPLNRLKIAVHYGCHSLRPKQMDPPEDAENPQWLWEFTKKILGAEPIHYLDETQCCGAGMREMDQVRALELAERKIRQMEEMGANAIMVPCPTCYLQFDAGQRLLLRGDPKPIRGTAVFYQAELLAVSMGASPESIGMQYHLVKPDPSLL